ncbi:MAG TPA: hypothetical protein VF551_08465, partial [Chthoniobacterales bacterium]
MRRLLLALVIAAAAAVAIWFGMRGGSPRISSTTVTALLPRETLAFVHIPDVREARAKWHDSDAYKLWREPAVQEFLQKPLARTGQMGAVSQKLAQIEELGMRDAFLAVAAWENQQAKLLGGFRFNGSEANAEKVIGQWRARLAQNAPSARRETVTYEGHRIDVVSEGAITVATVYAGDWFFAGNDVPALQALLDRADGRAKDPAQTLGSEETFTVAFKHMPKSYAVFAFGRLDRYFEQLAARVPENESAPRDLGMLRQVRSFAVASGFEEGKVRDVLFVAMPKAADAANITRSSLALTSADSFLYTASLVNFRAADSAVNPPASGGVAAPVQRLFGALATSGVAGADWDSAFGRELGIIGDWPANSRIPSLLATLPVRDAVKAKEVARALTAGSGAEGGWTITDKAGVLYASQPPSSPLVPVAPTVAVSDQLLVAGLDPASVERAITGGSGASGLTGSQLFKGAEKLVASP